MVSIYLIFILLGIQWIKCIYIKRQYMCSAIFWNLFVPSDIFNTIYFKFTALIVRLSMVFYVTLINTNQIAVLKFKN